MPSYEYSYPAPRIKSFRSFVFGVMLLAPQVTLAQIEFNASTVGTCPPGAEDHTFIEARESEPRPPAYYFPPVAASATHPGWPVELTVWRSRCADGKTALWLRMKDKAAQTPRPKVTVVQDGVEKGWFGLSCTPGAGKQTGFFVCERGTGPFFWNESTRSRPQLSYYENKSAGTDNLRSNATFSPERAFALRVENPQRWSSGARPLIYEIPAMDTPGNLEDVPEGIAGQWWNPADPGWGLLVDRNSRGNTYAAWLTYDEQGNSTWFVMPSSSTDPVLGGVAGDVYKYSQRNGEPWPGKPVGRFRLKFSDSRHGTFHLTIGDVIQTHPVERVVLKTAAGSNCASNESGSFLLEGNPNSTLGLERGGFACGAHVSYLTYDSAGAPIWFFGGFAPQFHPTCNRSSACLVESGGNLYRPRGRPYFQTGGDQQFELGSPQGWGIITLFTNIFEYRLGSVSGRHAIERIKIDF